MLFTTQLSLTKMAENIACKAKKIFVSFMKSMSSLMPMSYKTFFKLFDVKIKPVLLYGVELWGNDKVDDIERVHLFVCKYFMNTPLRSCNAAVLGDCGRYPLYIETSRRCIKYLRLLNLSDDRYVKKCYIMQKHFDQLGYINWVTQIRNNLYRNGFGYVWEQQRVDNTSYFLNLYVHRLKDQYLQLWRAECSQNSKLYAYIQFKHNFEVEKYLLVVDILKFRRSLSAFRTSSHQLMIEKGRHINLPKECRYCIFCDNNLETEYHFLLICQRYRFLTEKYIPKRYFTIPSIHRFNTLMSTGNADLIRNIARFIYYAMELRNSYIA